MTEAPASDREPGFYWVNDPVDGWVVAQWGTWLDRHAWWTTGWDAPIANDSSFAEIGPKIEPPAEPRMGESKHILVGPTAQT